jgi:cell wall-associated NlpC family hydrolase
MAAKRSTRRIGAAAIPAAIVFALTTPPQAIAAPNDDYPTWDEVEAARADENATRAEIEKIEGILVRLEQEAAALGVIALQKGEEYALAADALAEATAKLDRIRAQADAAQERAESSAQRVAALVAQLARTGGGDVTLGLLLGSADSTDELLAKLGTVSKLGASSAALLDRAIYDKKTAEALAADARAAERERARLAGTARTAYDAAAAAASAAEEQAAAQRADADRMYAQLATLKNTTAEAERAYQEGLQVPAPGTPVPGSPDPGTPPAPPAPPVTPPPAPPGPPVDPDPAPPVVSAVETAIAFATAQLGEPYQLGGAGPDVWDCSGLTKMSYSAAGVYIGTHSATNQFNTAAARGMLVTLDDLQRGDLLFYSAGGSVTATKYHVTLYLGGGLMIEAPRPGAPVRIVAVRNADLVPYAGRTT